ncbi:hypothetical protein ACFL21_01355 [Patescibacteria group bacterium]
MDPKKIKEDKNKPKGRKIIPEKDREGHLMEEKGRKNERQQSPGNRKKSNRKDHRDDS